MDTQVLVQAPALGALVPVQAPTEDCDPVNAYLGRLRTNRAREVQLGALEALSRLVLGPAAIPRGNARRLAWWTLCYQHTQAISTRLQERHVKFRESIVPRTGDTQFFLYDPDGVGVELNFPKT